MRSFTKKLSGSKAGFFYYAGHGLQVDGINYMVPVEADLGIKADVPEQTLSVDYLVQAMTDSKVPVKIVVLDACRNDPFKNRAAGDSPTRGLAPIQKPLAGAFLIYATSPNDVSQDDTGRNGVFTEAFVQNLKTPGKSFQEILMEVRKIVGEKSGGSQCPGNYDESTAPIYLASAGKAVQATVAKAQEDEPDFGAIQVVPGSASLSFASAGTLSFKGKTIEIPAGATLPVNKINPGDYPATMTYPDGQPETVTLTVEPGKTATVAFSYKPAPKAKEGESQTSRMGIEMVSVAGGTFQMGSTNGDSDEKPVYQVTLSSYLIGKTEVTQAQWQKVMGNNRSQFRGDNNPVEGVSWYDAVTFCNKLSQMEGLSPAYTINGTTVTWNKNATGYRLPTEAEWEYAAKGGAKGSSRNVAYAGSDQPDTIAWYGSNSGNTTHPVAQKQANDLGLFDMSGNVWEWCWDWYGDYITTVQKDPAGAASGPYRVNRGGSYDYGASSLRSANRSNSGPGSTGNDLGFRVVSSSGTGQ